MYLTRETIGNKEGLERRQLTTEKERRGIKKTLVFM